MLPANELAKNSGETISTLPNEQIKQLEQVLEVILLAVESEINKLMSTYSEPDSLWLLDKIIKIPYVHFPNTVRPYEINRIISWLAKNYDVITLENSAADGITIKILDEYGEDLKNLHELASAKYSEISASEKPESKKERRVSKDNSLKSIHLVTQSLEPRDVIFVVLDEHFEMPTRFTVKNNSGDVTYIKKLYDIAYIVNVPGKKVDYDKNLADCINNGLFGRIKIKNYMETNKLQKPTLVQKSENDMTLVLKNEIPVKTMLARDVPSQHRSLYVDKTQ